MTRGSPGKPGPLSGRPLSIRPEDLVEVGKLLFAATVDDRGCWVYPNPYPKVSYQGRSVGLHRLACAAAHGPIQRGQVVLHECDEPCCVNPAHLRAGTHEENMRDIVRKSRRETQPFLQTVALISALEIK